MDGCRTDGTITGLVGTSRGLNREGGTVFTDALRFIWRDSLQLHLLQYKCVVFG